mgnify:CR=1 FL=1
MSDFWQIFRFVIAALLTLAGVFCMISSVLGLYRFRYALTRIHAASLMDTVSIFLMLSGLSVAAGFTVATAKMVFVDYQPRRVAPDWAAGSDHQRRVGKGHDRHGRNGGSARKGGRLTMQVLHILLLVFIISCAVSVSLTKNLLTALVIFMGQSLAMSVIWILLESPDLAITEAAVGAGITSLLLFVTLKKIHAIDIQKGTDKTTNNVQEGVTRHGEDQE